MNGIRVFSIANIPVYISPFYLLLLFFFGMQYSHPAYGAIFALIVTISLLVHEFGHALAAKFFRLDPQILLHGIGGLTQHRSASSDRDDALIVAAGPAAGLSLAGLSFVAESAGLPQYVSNPRLAELASFFLKQMLVINVFWSVLNLLPIWPLDGGQLTRLAALRLMKPRMAEKFVHGFAVVILIFAALWGFRSGNFLLGIVALFLMMPNLSILRGQASGGPIRRGKGKFRELLEQAERAFAQGDYLEASRAAHLAKEDPASLSRVEETRLFMLLGIVETRLGRYESALSYLARSPREPVIIESMIECLHQLDRDEELDALLESTEFQRISPTRRVEILQVVRPSWLGDLRH
ncbi:MAG: hypothetical protein GX614_11700 [Sandaracinaceae bacterium]|nr:hypothetical protein [Sandaracinaceae bacterium]